MTGVPSDLEPLAGTVAARMAPALRGGAVYTDDRAPVDRSMAPMCETTPG